MINSQGKELNLNGLEVKEKIMPVSARVIVNMASMKLRREEIDKFLEEIEKVIPKGEWYDKYSFCRR